MTYVLWLLFGKFEDSIDGNNARREDFSDILLILINANLKKILKDVDSEEDVHDVEEDYPIFAIFS